MQKLRLGMIGAGKTARWHLKSYSRIPGVQIAAIANPRSEEGLKIARRYCAEHFTDGRDLIERSSLDAVDICAPTGLHKDFIIQALHKGLHVYTEKPMCGSVKDIEEIIAVNKTTQKIIFNGFNYRFLPEFCRIRSIINSGRLGKIRYIKMTRFTKENPSSYIFGHYSAGLFNEFHCHFVDLMFSFGFGAPEKVFSSGTTVHDWKIAPDTATMTLFYQDNMIAELTASFASPGLSPEALIIGTQGTLKLAYGRISVIQKKDVWPLSEAVMLMFKESLILPFRVLKNPFQWSCAHFIECVRNNARSACDETSALKTCKITNAGAQSYIEGRSISI